MKKIMIVADPDSRQQVALHRGLALAKKLNAEVRVLGFCYQALEQLPVPRQTELRNAIIAAKQQQLDEILADFEHSEVKLSSKTVWHKVIHQAILEHAEAFDAELLLKTGNRSEHFLYTPTDWHLLRNSKIPVMICAEKKWKRARPIVAALDLATKKPAKKRLNQRVMQLASQLSNSLELPLQVVSALDIPQVLKDLDLIDAREWRQKKLQEIEPVVQKLCEDYQLQRQQLRLITGEPHRVIPKEANRLKADLVVMGSMARGGVKGALQGNTGEKVLHHLRTDVVSVR